MSDLLAECDWRDGTLFLVLPEDPERIGVRLFPSRHAPSRVYVPEAEIVLTKAENAKLRELVLHMYTCMGNVDADGNYIEGCDLEMSLARSVKDAIETVDNIIREFEAIRDYLAAYGVFGKEPTGIEAPND